MFGVEKSYVFKKQEKHLNKFRLSFISAVIFAGFCTMAYAAVPTNLPLFVFEPAPVSQADCNRLKDQYGIKYCSFDNDYWVGAVFQCGGVHNLPSLQDFDEVKASTINRIFQNIVYINIPASVIDKIPLYTSDNYDYTPLPDNAGWWQRQLYHLKLNAQSTNYYMLDIKIPTLKGALSKKKELEDNGTFVAKWYFDELVLAKYKSVSRYGQSDKKVYGICRDDLLKLR